MYNKIMTLYYIFNVFDFLYSLSYLFDSAAFQ